MKVRSRLAGFSFLTALVFTGAWGAMHFVAGDRPLNPTVAALHDVAHLATPAMAWVLAMWILTTILIVRQSPTLQVGTTYSPAIC